MSHTLHGCGEIVRTMDGPFSYRTWVVRPDGSLDEVQPPPKPSPATYGDDWDLRNEPVS